MDFDQAAMWRRLCGDPGNYYTQAAEPDRAEFRAFIEGLLHTSTITVEFAKADGSTRAMICTLNEDQGAKYNHTQAQVDPNAPARQKAPNREVRTVWDCQAQAWRSFRWDRLKKVEFTVG